MGDRLAGQIGGDGGVPALFRQTIPPDERLELAGQPLPAALGAARDDLRLASFVRSILSGNSRYDRFVNGDRAALSAEEQAGLELFRGKANCVACP